MSETIHILGAGQWQVPTIRLAKALGYRVFVTDVYRERPGYAFADEHECVDIADLDLTLRTAEQHRIDGIVCDTTDVGVPTMAYAADRLCLPSFGYETAQNFTVLYGSDFPHIGFADCLEATRQFLTGSEDPIVAETMGRGSARLFDNIPS